MNTKEKQSKYDWDRVLAYKEGDRISYEPEDGPYDPNDAEATRMWLQRADLVLRGKVVRRASERPEISNPSPNSITIRMRNGTRKRDI